jgi:hypothetical protein
MAKKGKSKNSANHVANLEAAKRALDGLGINFFISHGSLLGWYR